MARALWKFAVILGSAEGFHVVPITAKTLSTLRTPAPAMDGQGSVWDVEKNVPRRWSSVHDCERPVKWREALDEEDCKIWRLHGEEAMQGLTNVPTKVIAQQVNKPTRYTDLVPSLYSPSDLVSVCSKSSGLARLVVVKFYSKKCRLCLRIAAKYRRLALDLSQDVDFFEACDADAPELCSALKVRAVPTVVILDPKRVRKLAMYTCKPSEWPKVDAKVRVAMLSMKKRRSIHSLIGTELVDDLQDAYSYFT